MKAVSLAVVLALAVGGSSYAGPSTNDWEVFQILRASLDPNTFHLSLTFTCIPGKTYQVQSHDGATTSNAVWTTGAELVATNLYLTYFDDLSGSLTTNGRTYRAIINQNVTTVNEEFIAYPFMTNPVVSIEVSGGASNNLLVGYGDGLYSNQVHAAGAEVLPVGFFRMWSSNADPKNAVIQMSTNGVGSGWEDLPAD